MRIVSLAAVGGFGPLPVLTRALMHPPVAEREYRLLSYQLYVATK